MNANRHAEMIRNHGFETRSFPNLLAATLRGFTFYLADPISSIHRIARIGRLRLADHVYSVPQFVAGVRLASILIAHS